MIAQITDPTKMIKTLASLIIKDGKDVSKILAFVPTRRAGRKLERVLAEKSGGAAVMPKIIPLGEGDDSEEEIDGVAKIERKIILAKILQSVADKAGIPTGFSGAISVAGELIVLQDYLENEGIDARAINWSELIPDAKKAALMNAIKDVKVGATPTEIRNAAIRQWKGKLSEYSAVYCCGSTASVKPARELMSEIAKLPDGYVIMPGLVEDFRDIGRSDPYWSIKKFVLENGGKIELLDVPGVHEIDFFNNCFNNDLSEKTLKGPGNLTQIDCKTESEEANAVAVIAAMAKERGESVMIITPDVSGEQRIKSALSAYGLKADSSGGTPLSETHVGRFAGLLLDYLGGNENKDAAMADLARMSGNSGISIFDGLKYTGDLSEFIIGAMEKSGYKISNASDANALFDKISELSKLAKKYDLNFQDVSELLQDAIKSESVRPPMTEDYDVVILGTAEARMQTADVVILTGLNEGMFPKGGFRHSWLPRNIARKIGLPDADSKVSLMALDFMTLSCNGKVYWTRSRMAGGNETVPSRFLSRVSVRARINQGSDILDAVRDADNVPFIPIKSIMPYVKYDGDYYATWIEDLMHNPYQFYAKHILHLRKYPDIGDPIGAREFGAFIHDVLEYCANAGISDAKSIVRMLEAEAEKYIDRENVLFKFWQNRFNEMAPVISDVMKIPARTEETIQMAHAGHNFIAKADRIENNNRVVDYKTGAIPSDTQLGLGKETFSAMPQLPLEAMILRETTGNPDISMAFVSLGKNRAGIVEYDAEKTSRSIDAVKKTLEIALNMTKYERPDHYLDDKYAEFDDLCRYGD